MKRHLYGISILLVILFVLGCPSPTSTPDTRKNNDKSLTSFSFTSQDNNETLKEDMQGTITETSISLSVPFGTDLSALKATFTTTGKSVAVGGTVQASGTTPNNFTSAVTYTVTAENGTSQTYRVTVTIAPIITKFIFASTDNAALDENVVGEIRGKQITLLVPFGTDVSALKASFDTNGKSVKVDDVSQTSGITANDFSKRRTYRVMTADGKTRSYNVRVIVKTKNTKEMISFHFASQDHETLKEDIQGTISGTSITLSVPFGTDLSALKATFTTTGNSVAVGGTVQASGTTPNNFTTAVTYTVTAEDGSSQAYTVTVTIAPNSAKELTDFRFLVTANTALGKDITGTINGHVITLTVPYGTDLSTLKASFTITGKSVAVDGTVQASGTTPNNFTTAVTYTVTAEDGSSQTYTVTVTIAPNSAKELTDFRFPETANTALGKDITGTVNGHAITLTVPYRTDVTALKASFITSTAARVTVGGTVQSSGTTPNNFTSAVTYTVTAEDGSSQTYTVTVTIAPNSAKELTDFRFLVTANTALGKDITGTVNGHAITLTVPYRTDVTALKASFITSTGARVTVGGTVQSSGTTPNNFTSAVTYTVTAEDGSSQTYTVTIADIAAIEDSNFRNALMVKNVGVLTLPDFSRELKMIYVNDLKTITFPTGRNDDAEATLRQKFWMGETEVTNAVFATVYQWASNNDKFSMDAGSPNLLDFTTAKHRGKQLIDLDETSCHVKYIGSGGFSVTTGYETYPVTNVTWYGAIMFCNWLTEMRDGNTTNVVYDSSVMGASWWDHHLTTINMNKNGYRLPSSHEWEYVARYRGTDSTNTVSGYDNPRYTKGNSASGATTYYNDVSAGGKTGDPGKSANDAVAVYGKYWNGTTWTDTGSSAEVALQSVKSKTANALGLYDMSGNVNEWCFDLLGSFRITRGGGWNSRAEDLQVGERGSKSPNDRPPNYGFRLSRTAD